MSQRMPDYEDLRARQARAQESIVTAPEEVRALIGGHWPIVSYDPTDDPEGRALVQAIHDRKASS